MAGRILLATDPEAHDAWFRAKVREALDDPRPAVPHEQVMTETQALIDRKRRARSLNGRLRRDVPPRP